MLDCRNDYFYDVQDRPLKFLWREFKTATAGLGYDTIACRGVSGLLVAPLLARLAKKHLVVSRKDNDDSHHGARLDGRIGDKILIVDDFISSGETVGATIRAIIKECAKKSKTYDVNNFVGFYSYRDHELFDMRRLVLFARVREQLGVNLNLRPETTAEREAELKRLQEAITGFTESADYSNNMEAAARAANDTIVYTTVKEHLKLRVGDTIPILFAAKLHTTRPTLQAVAYGEVTKPVYDDSYKEAYVDAVELNIRDPKTIAKVWREKIEARLRVQLAGSVKYSSFNPLGDITKTSFDKLV